MPAFEPVAGLRVVADAGAIDRATWTGAEAVTLVRIAPDEALAIGATTVEIDDPDAIVEPEHGFSAARLDETDEAGLARLLGHVEFAVPRQRPAVVQGKVAGVPAKLLLRDGLTLLIVQTAFADELEARLR